MKIKSSGRGFTLIEVMVAIAIFALFAFGIYGTISMLFKVVYQSRVKILETAILSEQLEIARNLPYESVGIVSGIPSGLIPHTQTVVRNGISFTITATVRNYDDPFDGMATGTPTKDTSPADYKLVEFSIGCAVGCSQNNPVILSTTVSPKGLEGASQNGALFINVFDANGLPVEGANVHVVNTTVSPNIIVDDVTGADGWLKIIDAPTGTRSYDITVSKSGYSSDYTTVNVGTSTPVKPPVNIASQMVTESYYSIDRLGAMNIFTANENCAAVGGVGLNIYGDKKIGTDPDYYKLNHNFSTNGTGQYNFGSIEWDKYSLALTGSSYDIAGTIPLTPVSLSPGATQQMIVILKAHTTNSLLVKVRDNGTKLPLADALVTLSGNGFDDTLTTGLGYVRQTDWSGGPGQADYTNEIFYWSDDGHLDNASPDGDLKLKEIGNHYLVDGYLESSTFDLGGPVDFHNIIWESLAQPIEAGDNSVLFQLATSNSSTPEVWNFSGPDGTAGTFYTVTSTIIWGGHDSERYLRYRVFLHTVDDNFTPTLSEVAFTYTNSCTPPGQVFFSGLSSGDYNLSISRAGYMTVTGTVDVSGRSDTIINMSTN